jgi:4-methylaminobutanoate oxidase (formaldehyde-forming)
VLRKREAGLTRRLAQFQLTQPEPLLYHAEPILRDGQVVGYLTSGNYGHYLGAAVGLGYVPTRPGESVEALLGRSYEIEVAGARVAAIVSLRPLYDPTSARSRA